MFLRVYPAARPHAAEVFEAVLQAARISQAGAGVYISSTPAGPVWESPMQLRTISAALLGVVALSGCSSLYYAGMEKLGKEKRDILVSRVKEGREDQEEARKQIQTTMEAFKSLTGFEGGDLEKTYNKLNKEYERCEGKAKELKDQIASIDKVSKDMFTEWEKEIGQIGNAELKSKSRGLLNETRTRYQQLSSKMRATEARMEPVLAAFRDQVLFLKHNLNAKAITSLKQTIVKMDANVDSLVKDIDASMKEADSFIASMSSQS
jgi:outer membrane murein-binding lipoprotein Lpp/ElaB/YqjD/DUF883 family membrane-anchored ribosome-binding protein